MGQRIRSSSLLLAVALVSPPSRAAPTARVSGQLDRREAVEDELEPFLDSEICARLQAGERRLPLSVAAPGVGLPLDELAWVTGCGIRPLSLVPGEGGAAARLLCSFEGFGASGDRRSLELEADATFERVKGHWRLATFRSGSARSQSRNPPRFEEVADEAGLVLPRDAQTADARDTFPRSVHGGLTVRDLDGDGLDDIVAVDLTQAWLFRNRGGLRFEREPLGPKPPPGAWLTGAVTGDVDGDGRPDIILLLDNREADPRLAAQPAYAPQYLHNEGGHFVPRGAVGPPGPYLSAVAADLDGDGRLDLVLVPYGSNQTPAPGDLLEADDGLPPVFLLGHGDGTFRPVPVPHWLERRRWGLAPVAADLTRAGRVQVYVANDYGSSDLWTLLPDGGLTETGDEAGLRDPGNGMSADLGDVDGDGRLDLYKANMFSKAGTRVVGAVDAAQVGPALKRRLDKFAAGNTLYLSTDAGFEERGQAWGVNRGYWAYGSVFLDIDDDGQLDIAVADGYLTKTSRKDL